MKMYQFWHSFQSFYNGNNLAIIIIVSTSSKRLLEISKVSTVFNLERSSGKVFNRLPCKINLIDTSIIILHVNYCILPNEVTDLLNYQFIKTLNQLSDCNFY